MHISWLLHKAQKRSKFLPPLTTTQLQIFLSLITTRSLQLQIVIMMVIIALILETILENTNPDRVKKLYKKAASSEYNKRKREIIIIMAYH